MFYGFQRLLCPLTCKFVRWVCNNLVGTELNGKVINGDIITDFIIGSTPPYGCGHIYVAVDMIENSESIQENDQKEKNNEKNNEKSENSGIVNSDALFYIGKSLGAKAKNYNVSDPNTGNIYHFKEGEYIQDVTVFAGYKSNKQLDENVVEGLVKNYGGNPKKWQHAKGIGIIEVDKEELKVDVHWFQEDSVGKVKFKIKEWLN